MIIVETVRQLLISDNELGVQELHNNLEKVAALKSQLGYFQRVSLICQSFQHDDLAGLELHEFVDRQHAGGELQTHAHLFSVARNLLF